MTSIEWTGAARLVIAAQEAKDRSRIRQGLPGSIAGQVICVSSLDELDSTLAVCRINLVTNGAFLGKALRTPARWNSLRQRSVVLLVLAPRDLARWGTVLDQVDGVLVTAGDSDRPDIMESLVLASCGHSTVPRQLALSLADGREIEQAARKLSTAERSLFRLLGEGLSNRQIAERHGISPQRAKAATRKVLRKLGLPGRAAAVTLNRRLGG